MSLNFHPCQVTQLPPPLKRSFSPPKTDFRDSWPHSFIWDEQLLQTRHHSSQFLQTDLCTPKLDAITPFLWLAGLPRPARPLHRQRVLRRSIVVTEAANEHLVWHENYILIKPLPEYLLYHEFWKQELGSRRELHQSACGLLLSYIWLVRSANDLRIAHEMALLPKYIDFRTWRALMDEFMDNIGGQSLGQVGTRYEYGELRLSRLNSLYRWGAAGMSFRHVVYGFLSGSTRYNSFFERNFSWILVVLVYVTVILSAMQVGLATDDFQNSGWFQSLSYGVALGSICVVIIAVLVMFGVWTVLFAFHFLSTRQYKLRRESGGKQDS